MNRTNKLLVFLSLLLAFPLSINAATEQVDIDNIRYAIDLDNKSAAVSGLASGTELIVNLTIPDYIEYEGIQYPVTSIGFQAFTRCSGLKGSLTIGNSVTTIGEAAFYGCRGFTESLTIGNSVTTVDDGSFSGCSGFSELYLPQDIKYIGNKSFSDIQFKIVECSGLTPPYTPEGNDYCPFTDYSGTLFVPDEAIATYKSTDPWSRFKK